jgi:hypothetical protein
MRRLSFAIALCLPALPAFAQSTPPLSPYVPPPSSAPLAPLPDATPAPPDEQALGDVRAKSNTASNISAADTRSPIAPALPAPDVSGSSAHDYLVAARGALQAGQTGAAQQALEQAETRILDRDVAPSAANDPIHGPVIHEIEAARQALSVGNTAAALQAIGAALGA